TTRENPAGLTRRQLEVLELVSEGMSDSEIAARLFLSERTVGHHVSAILRKLEVRNRGQAAAEAVRLRLASQDSEPDPQRWAGAPMPGAPGRPYCRADGSRPRRCWFMRRVAPLALVLLAVGATAALATDATARPTHVGAKASPLAQSLAAMRV